MKTILCYGDSNTWGHDPRTLGRYGPHERWPGVLQDELGAGFRVVEEGLCGRTTCFPDPFDPALDGRALLPAILKSHKPLDLVAIMLGTNDLKTRFAAPAADIAWGAGLLVETVQKSVAGPLRPGSAPAGWPAGTPLYAAPQVLLIAPPPIKTPPDPECFAAAGEKSREFGRHYRQIAELYQCHFLDAGQVIESSDVDGVHLDREAHLALGRAVAQRVRAVLGAEREGRGVSP
ncbi:MAG: SGNH/GDSL hydrolase family protein [Planctomycetota bacterium]